MTQANVEKKKKKTPKSESCTEVNDYRKWNKQLRAWRKVMAAYRRVYDSRHLQANCLEPGSARNPTLGNRVWAIFFSFNI